MPTIELIAILVTIASLFIWNRAEARADIRHRDVKIDSIRDLTHAIHKETTNQLNGIREEMKDFHSRLERQDYEFKEFMKRQEETRWKRNDS